MAVSEVLQRVSTRCPSSFLRGLLVAGILVGGLGASPCARAQDVADEVTSADGIPLFQVMATGGVVAPGTFGQGAVPVEGPGTRFVWHPAKAALRAGRVGFGMSDGMEWDDGRMGAYSAAFGVNTEASGRGAVAGGQGTAATGEQSLAAGYRTTASGLRAAALGDGTTARGQFATALGLNTTARAYGSVALGRWNETRGGTDAWRASDPLLVAGNGRGPSNRSNALLLRKNGDLTIAGTLTEHSDRRLKTDVRALGPVGDALQRLQPVRFRFADDTGHPTTPQLGLLAQDVQAEFPSLVDEGSDGLLSLSYSRLTTVLLKGLQEQQTRIDSLQQRLDRVDRLAESQAELARQVNALRTQRQTPSRSALVPVRGMGDLSGLLLALGAGLLGLALGRRWG